MTIFPVFRYQDAPGAIAWLMRAFGFEKQAEHLTPDGAVAHAELRYGTGVIGVSSRGKQDPKNPWTAIAQGIYACVGDVDAHHASAKAAGAAVVMPLKDTDYGSREYGVRDPFDNLWGFGTYPMQHSNAQPNMFVGLRCPDGVAALEWFAKAFGFEKTLEIPNPHGGIVHAEMKLGDSILMISGGSQQGLWGDVSQATYVLVDDPDAHFARAAAAGARILQEPKDTPFGARAYYARDIEGFLWSFSTYDPYKGL